MNRLSYNILPYPDDRTYQLRWIVDGRDWIGPEWIGTAWIGLDPAGLVPVLTATSQEFLFVARCICGVIGCSDLIVDVRRTKDAVDWCRYDLTSLKFNKYDYDRRVAQLAQDRSWEPIGRRLERELNTLFKGRKTADGHVFNWASTRCRVDVVTISATKDGHQWLWEIRWDGHSFDAAKDEVAQTRRENFGG